MVCSCLSFEFSELTEFEHIRLFDRHHLVHETVLERGKGVLVGHLDLREIFDKSELFVLFRQLWEEVKVELIRELKLHFFYVYLCSLSATTFRLLEIFVFKAHIVFLVCAIFGCRSIRDRSGKLRCQVSARDSVDSSVRVFLLGGRISAAVFISFSKEV